MDEPANDPVEPSPPPFWSPLATIGWGLVIMIVFVAVQVVVVIAWGLVRLGTEDSHDPGALAADLATSGDVLSVGTLATAFVCGGLVLLLAAVKGGASPSETLGLGRPPAPALARWLVLTLVLIAFSDGLTTILGKSIVPDFMADIVASTNIHPLLWLAIIVAAPLFEELFFRGFLMEGLRRGPLGDAGAIILSALAWASIHIQYGMYEICTIFVFGAVLGLARVGSRSLWVPVAMHMTANLVATLEAYLLG